MLASRFRTPDTPNAAKTVDALHEAKGRMEEVQHHNGNEDHNSFEADKQSLLFDKVAGPSLGQFSDAVDGSNENEDGCNS